jgi:GR25 family glycosyltransferase involved in LPS biosynthesis
MVKLFYINLDRRTDRNEHVLCECNKACLNDWDIERFPAIECVPEHLVYLFKNADYISKPFEKPVMCNQLSHYFILKRIIEENIEVSLICQDDIIFIDNFKNYITNLINYLPPDTEMVNFGLHEFAEWSTFVPWDLGDYSKDYLISKQNINYGICKMHNHINPCSLGYIVTLQGAKNMVTHFEKIGFLRATDRNFNDYLIEKDIFYGSTVVLATSRIDLGSDVFKKGETM